MEENKIRQSINAYSRSKKGHPYEDYGNKIKITGNEECPVMSCSLRTQYEGRGVYKTIRPHLGGTVGQRTVTSTSSIDPWKMQIDEPRDFVRENHEYTIEGSEWVDTCDTCNGMGENTCMSCRGKGRETCPDCDGRGTEECNTCRGSGYELCPECHGQLFIKCEYCSGHGHITKTRKVQKHVYNYQLQRDELKEVEEKYTDPCPSCHGKGTWRCSRCYDTVGHRGYIPCRKCGNMGYLTCGTCNGKGELVCKTCSGRGKLICKTCEGHRKLLHGIAIGQYLDEETQRRYIGDKRVLDLASKIQLYGTYLLKERGGNLGKNLIPNEPRCNDAIKGFFDNARRSDAQILFQEAKVMRCPMQFITYSLDGQTYTGIIHHDTFYPNGSPIDDYAEGLVEKAERKSKLGSSIDTLNLLDKAETIGADQSKVNRLREKAEQHLDVLYKTGVDIVFWMLALFFTPVLFNFYSNINPVAKWAILSNNPTWSGYKLVAITQCAVFLLAIFILKLALGERDRSGHRFHSIWGYVLAGMGKYLGLSIVILAVLLALNYFGVSILTTIIAIIIGFILKVIVILIVWVILLVKTLIEKIF